MYLYKLSFSLKSPESKLSPLNLNPTPCNQIRSILEDNDDPAKVFINFEGGQRPYQVYTLQGYLAHKKRLPRRTLQKAYG